MTSHRSVEPESNLRVVLVGQERVGKSSAGNTILRNKEFNSEDGLKLLTLSSKKAENEVLSRRVSVVDTPGLCSSVLKPEEVKAEIQRAVKLSSPGPHVFLLTIKLGRFTEQEERGLKMLQEILGPEVSKNIMILFTHRDRLEQTGIDIHQFVQRDENLQKLVKSCSGMYHVFNNKKMEDRKQVQDLLDKIDSLNNVEDPAQVGGLVQKINRMVKRNGGRCYTNEMFREPERAKQEEIKRLLRENPDMNPEDARRQAETDNLFIRSVLEATAAGGVVGGVCGAGIGAIAGAIRGPIGAAIGAGVGAAVGFPVGAVLEALVAVKRMGGCVIQ
ncbi:GTPase IMAP family member 4-like isoform X1 [Xiphophorus couchianus]|uniref:GTPase IMAP family member 4-like isoform X1 n=1 Tax=Xiphophorus couchianus TaxID=32473 RepID=UPI0010160C21|nr:GTPase IMAP family member 4-like isoform X1 [Xiphophorus couchianus]